MSLMSYTLIGIPAPWLLLVLVTFIYLLFFFRRWFLNRHLYVPSFQPKIDIGPAAGVHSIQGRRSHMEDTYQAVTSLDGDSKKAFYGVFDGHGGHACSEYTADNLHKLILKQKYSEQQIPSLKSGFKQLDHDWLSIAEKNNMDDGSTVISCLIVNGVIYVANVGDSRAVLSSNGKAIPMSRDHKPNREDEKSRIEKLGGRIIHYGTWRVEGVLAVTRAIGDRKLKTYVTAIPEIMDRKISESDEFLILASDGVWDVFKDQDAVDIVKSASSEYGNVQAGAKKLTEASYHRGSMDNITSLVIDLSYYRKGSSSSSSS